MKSMNMKGWILGFIITLLQTSVTGFNIMGQFPTATANQIVIVLYPVVVGMIVTFLVRSPIPGAVLPPGMITGANGSVQTLPQVKAPEVKP